MARERVVRGRMMAVTVRDIQEKLRSSVAYGDDNLDCGHSMSSLEMTAIFITHLSGFSL